MRSLDRARQKALLLRPLLGDDVGRRLERLSAYLDARHAVRPLAVEREFLHGGRGEVAPAEGFLYYDRKLDTKPYEKLELFAHELGHLVLHAHLTRTLVPGDPLRGSAFLEHGTPALARYSRRSFEEAEASAFAAELLCPADEVFARWRRNPEEDTETLAETFGVSLGLVRVQLAEGLYRFVRGAERGAAEEGPDEALTNEDQETAATWTGSPVLVEAGPGTGKTRTLVRRVVHLVRERSAAPEGVLVLTFSNEAAEELRVRLEQSLGAETAAEILVATFHGFGMIVLHSYGHLAGLGSEFAVLDEASREEVLSEVIGRLDCEPILNVQNPLETVRRLGHVIGYLKDRLLTPDRFAAELEGAGDDPLGERSRALSEAYRAYEEEKSRLDRVDFADLVLLPLGILRDHGDVRREVREQFAWVMVDEYQDVSRSMAMLLQEICGGGNPPWVVGDARQAIYRFRGAAPENVRRFAEDFPGGRSFLIGLNYRSSPPIVDAANRLAAYLEDEDPEGEPRRRWSPGSDVEPLGPDPIRIVAATSDAAERGAVVEQVRAWRAQGIAAGEIGVLARRNIDVRNIALALADAGIRAVTSGLVTAEGAAGDLAAAVTLLDAPRAAIPRLAYAVGRGDRREDLNAAVRFLLEEESASREEDREGADEGGEGADEGGADGDGSETGQAEPEEEAATPAAREVADAVGRVTQALEPLEHSGDGWAVICGFLFDSGDYLRRLVADDAELDAALALEEIVSALAFAGSYRFGHPGITPRKSRRRMAERFRDLLTNAAPGLIPPRLQAGAVRVMTCHASKGLEFPCVIVAGQTLNVQPTDRSWLPEFLRDDPAEELEQADSLLFVGVTRAQRALVVSYAETAGGTVRSPRRTLPALLERWIASGAVPVETRDAPAVAALPVEMTAVWGGRRPERLSMYALSGRLCPIRGYLENDLGAGLRPVLRPLYPVFVTRAGRAMQRVAAEANRRGRPLTPEEAEAIAAEEWPAGDHAEHPHVDLYRPRALRQVKSFAEAYRPAAVLDGDFAEELTWKAADVSAVLPLHLVARYRDPGGRQVAVTYRPESLGGGGEEQLNWSDLKEHHRLPLVLLHGEDPELAPYVYSGKDGRFYPYKWSARKPRETLAKERKRAREVFESRVKAELRAEIKDWTCDRCPCRMLCPFWIGAVETPD